jgi:hypothetical protein
MTDMRPRHWADLILKGEASLEDVPAHLRKSVRGYLEDIVERGKTTDATRIRHYVGLIVNIETKEGRAAALLRVPEQYREKVRLGVIEEWKRAKPRRSA